MHYRMEWRSFALTLLLNFSLAACGSDENTPTDQGISGPPGTGGNNTAGNAGNNNSLGGSNAQGGETSAGQGGTSAGQGGTSAGQGGTSAGQGGTSAGQGGTSAGQGGTSAGQGGTSAGQGGTGPMSCEPGRHLGDQSDDEEGFYQIKVNYVLPSDGIDEELDLNGKIEDSVKAWSQWFAAQTGGIAFRLDTCDGNLDIRFVRLSRTEAELKAKGVFIRDAIEEEMGQMGLLSSTKLESVYYGGDAAETCGSAAWPPALIGRVGAVYLKGTFSNPSIPPCASNPLGNVEQPTYFDFSMLHEIVHLLGFAPSCAPHHVLSGHVSDSPNDLMYAGSLPWNPTTLDVGNDDYFGANIPGCPDLSTSVFLSPLPANAQLPPGW
jgi:hypothetical protein